MASELRRRLGERLHPSPPSRATRRSDYDLNPGMRPIKPARLIEAGVLVPLVEREGEVAVLLTQRAEGLPDHAGQISFPGGKVHVEDASAVAAALRETEEEIGIPRDRVNIAGYLDRYETRTGFCILPVVGFVPPDLSLLLDAREVAAAFEVPLAFVMDPRRHARHARLYEGRERLFYAMPYRGYYIWGATAGILKSMYDRLYGD